MFCLIPKLFSLIPNIAVTVSLGRDKYEPIIDIYGTERPKKDVLDIEL